MSPNGSKVQEKKSHQGYESWEMYSSEEESEYEFDLPKILETIEKSLCETQKFQTTSDNKEDFQSKEHPNDSCIPKNGSQDYFELVRQCKQNEARITLTKINSTNSAQRSSQLTTLDNGNLQSQDNSSFWKSSIKVPVDKKQSTEDQQLILAKKGLQMIKNEKPNKIQKETTLNEDFQSKQQSNGSCIPKKGSQLYIELVRQCKQKKAKVIVKKIKSTNCVQRSSPKTASDVLDEILAEKGTKDHKLIENEKPNKVRKGTTLNENFIKWKNSKSEKELNEKFPLKCKSASEDRWKRKLACNNTTSNAKKPNSFKNSINDEKLIYARKSTDKEKLTKVDKPANLKQSNKGTKYSASREKSSSGQKSIAELMSEVVESSGKFFCPENCGKFFGTKAPFYKHLLAHRPKSEWPFVCLFCGQTFQARADLPKHFRTTKHSNDSRIPKQGTPAWVEMISKSVNKI